MSLLKMSDVPLKGKRVLLREDLNVPLKDGEISSDIRIRAAIPTIQYLLKAGAKVMILSHLGRPTEGMPEAQFSLAPVAKRLSELLKQPVPLVENWLQGVNVKEGQAVLCENVRFNTGETSNSEDLSKQMAELCDVFVMDAFATAHRAEASTYGIAKYVPVACAGPLLLAEVEALDKALANPKRPVVAIVGGSKVSTKLSILDSLSKFADQLIVGGGIANTFIAASGYDVGQSLCEVDLIDEAERLTANAKARGADIPIPTDVVVAERMSPTAEAYVQPVSQVGDTEKIFDIGPETTKELIKIIKKAGTIIWNGPVGAFEVELFEEGTKQIANAIAESKAFSIAGGGDTLAAIEKYNITNKISYISTGGGAFLAYLERKKLPAIAILEERAAGENNAQ